MRVVTDARLFMVRWLSAGLQLHQPSFALCAIAGAGEEAGGVVRQLVTNILPSFFEAESVARARMSIAVS